MRALPERLESVWIKAECDPDGQVEYKLQPLINRLTLDIGMRANKPDGVDEVGCIFDSVSWGLKGLRGLMYENMAAEEGAADQYLPFEIEFEDARIGRETMSRVTEKSLRALPNTLMIEISNAVAKVSGITPKEAEEVKNTFGSQEPDSTVADATETSEPASTTAETEESCSEPEIFPNTEL